ncbi:MAG: 2-oxoglutarate dehydrogenase E1 component, partial [Orrella sp.]
MSSHNEALENSYLFGGNAPYVEELYESYLNNPGSVPDNWRSYFDQLQHQPATDGQELTRDQPHAPIVDAFVQRAKQGSFAQATQQLDLTVASKQLHVQSLIAAYRSLGSRWAELDPLKQHDRDEIPELDPAFYGLSEVDMDQEFSATNTYFTSDSTMTLRQIIKALRDTYCRSIGVEFMHCSDPVVKRWIQQRLESIRSAPSYTNEEKCNILQQLTESEGLERFLHTKYVGQKRFSLEGGESFIASMDELVNHAGVSGIQEIVVGMAHRGRLNVLVNIMGKMPGELFAEFEGKHAEGLTDGDVKYHNGFSSDLSTRGGP